VKRRYSPNDKIALREYGIDPFTSKEEWKLPDHLRDAWYVAATDAPPYPYYNQFYQPWRDTVQTEVNYKGYRIVAQTYTGAFDKSDSMGFDVPVAFSVLDDFDEAALPLIHHWFWSPWDARNAIDFYEWIKTTIDKKKWPTTPAHEFNFMLAYRRKIPAVFRAIHDIKKLIAASRDFDENPAQAIYDRITLMETEIRSWGDERDLDPARQK
jgi:hypothetical protein